MSLVGRRPDLCRYGQQRADLADELLRRDTRLSCDLDLVELALLVEELLTRRDVEDRDRRTADRRESRELGDARDRELSHAVVRSDPDRVADLVTIPVGGLLVDCDLAAASRPAARHECHRVEALTLLRVEAEGEARGKAVLDCLAVATDELRVLVR